MTIKIGSRLRVLPRGVGQGCPTLKLGEICIVRSIFGDHFDFTVDGVMHTGWNSNRIGQYFTYAIKPAIIIEED